MHKSRGMIKQNGGLKMEKVSESTWRETGGNCNPTKVP